MKRLTVLFGTNNERLLDLLQEIVPAEPPSLEKIWPPIVFEFPENTRPQGSRRIGSSSLEPRTQQERKNFAFDIVEQSKHRPVIMCTQDEIIFTAIRVAIHQGKISADEVEFRWYDGQDEVVMMPVDSGGRMGEWPPGFFNVIEQLLSILLGPRGTP